MGQVSTREVLQELAAKPIGIPEEMGTHDNGYTEACREAAQRAQKIWLPAGKRPILSPEGKAHVAALNESQTNLEDAVEAAGGERGHMGRAA
jgi:formate-dependent phosphoribosylglycinamide formyltransferase (GAR transformylase)